MEHAYTGPQYDRRARPRPRSAPAGFEPERLDDDAALRARRRADRRRRRRRLVPGADGVRAARARQPLDRRRSAAARHEGHPQRADQAPRAVPPVRAVDPRRGDRRVVRAGLHLAVHGARLQDARRTSATRSRPSTTSTTPAACRRSRSASSPRYYRLIKEFGDQTGVPILLNTSFNENEPIVMTPEHARRDVREDADGPARARQLRRAARDLVVRREQRVGRRRPGVARRPRSRARRCRAAPRSAASPSSRSSAARSAAASPGGTSSPVTPSSTASASPPTAVATTGRPYAIASRATTP